MRFDSSWAKACRGLLFPDQSDLLYAGIESVAFDSFAGGEEERYFAPLHDAQGGGPAGDQSSRDGGVVPKHKVPGTIVPRVGSPRWFPGEILNRRVWPVAKTTVTSPCEREMQVRILPREFSRVAKLAKRLMFRGR